MTSWQMRIYLYNICYVWDSMAHIAIFIDYFAPRKLAYVHSTLLCLSYSDDEALRSNAGWEDEKEYMD